MEKFKVEWKGSGQKKTSKLYASAELERMCLLTIHDWMNCVFCLRNISINATLENWYLIVFNIEVKSFVTSASWYLVGFYAYFKILFCKYYKIISKIINSFL